MNLAPRNRAARMAATLAAIGFASLAVFQLAIAAGAPWGHAAWGGENAHLSAAQQGASAVAAVIYVAAALCVLCRAGVVSRARSDAADAAFQRSAEELLATATTDVATTTVDEIETPSLVDRIKAVLAA